MTLAENADAVCSVANAFAAGQVIMFVHAALSIVPRILRPSLRSIVVHYVRHRTYWAPRLVSLRVELRDGVAVGHTHHPT